MPDVRDNNRYRCRGCGEEVPEDVATRAFCGCPRCGRFTFEQILVVAVCDLCSENIDPEKVYTHYTAAFEVPTPFGSKGSIMDPEWAVCPPCHELVLAGDTEGLLDRSVQTHLRLHPTMDEGTLRAVCAIPHAGFWKHYDKTREPHRGDPSREETKV